MKDRTIRSYLGLICLCLLVFCAAGCLAEGEETAEACLNAMRQGQKDAWVLAILDSGAEDVKVEDGTVSFSLCAYDPDIRSLGGYAGASDKAAWRENMLRNISAHNLRVTVTVDENGNFRVNKPLETVRQGARSARNGFGTDSMKKALADLLFPSPTAARKPKADSLVQAEKDFLSWAGNNPALTDQPDALWAALFYVQRNVSFSIKAGPRELSLTWDGADPEKLLENAYYASMSGLSGVTGKERTGKEKLKGYFDTKLAEAAIQMKQGRLLRQKMTVDLLDLCAGKVPDAYTAYAEQFDYAAWLDMLRDGYDLLPEEASQPFPKTGTLTVNAKKGRTVSVTLPQEDLGAYVQLRDADTQVIISDAFIRGGKTASLKVPEGAYVVHYARGTAWYGQNALFGDAGEYAASDSFIIGKSKVKLNVMEEQDGISLHAISVGDFAPAEDTSVWIKGVLAAQIELQTYPEVNPVVEGESPTTGLPASGEEYTPILMVLDNAEDAYPHWGVSKADIIWQVPNAGSGATKLLALFGDQYPQEAGPVRSGRASMLPSALSFQAAFAFAGPPAVREPNVDIEALMKQWKMANTHRVYNLLHSNGFSTRRSGLIRSHDMSCYIESIHRNLVEKQVEFEKRPFLFADEARTEGDTANVVSVLHRGESSETASNSASRAVFVYDTETGAYSRQNSSGLYLDRDTGENVQFANVLVLRTKLSYEKNYVFLKNHLVGSGTLEIFQSGHYVRGAWVRSSVDGRLVLVDGDGSELKLQRGKTFIVITNEITDVIYAE